ncbi:MAG: hypothetical protein K6F56_05445 [Oscillospiraceae bacterium]|nr:hypothetical protein [Oscillospiraceae bacterium]
MSDLQGQNKYSVYRKIRYDRTYRPLGKMSWPRVVLGLVLLASVFFLSGTVSGFFAARGSFHTAERLMLSERWMERYRPEFKAYLAAGVLYEDGDYEGAYEAVRAIGESEQARVLESAAAVKLAGERLAAQAYDAAFEAVCAADYERLDEGLRAEYRAVCAALRDHYAPINSIEANEKLKVLASLPGGQGS